MNQVKIDFNPSPFHSSFSTLCMNDFWPSWYVDDKDSIFKYKENGLKRSKTVTSKSPMLVDLAASYPPASGMHRSQTFSAATNVRLNQSFNLHNRPSDLQKRYNMQIKKKQSGLFTSKPPIPKVPRVDRCMDTFVKLQSALSECITILQDNIYSSDPSKSKKNLEHKIGYLEDRLTQVRDMYEFYMYQLKIREGAQNLMSALSHHGSREGQDKCKSNFKQCTEKLCEIEGELESRLGVLKIKVTGLGGFARLCSGDIFEVFFKLGSGQKWRSKCKIEKGNLQKWIDSEVAISASVLDELHIKVVELKKMQSNIQVGTVVLRTREYLTAKPQVTFVPINSTGSLKLRLAFEWRPYSRKEEREIAIKAGKSSKSRERPAHQYRQSHDDPSPSAKDRSKRDSMLSEVVFLSPGTQSPVLSEGSKSTPGSSDGGSLGREGASGSNSGLSSGASSLDGFPLEEVIENPMALEAEDDEKELDEDEDDELTESSSRVQSVFMAPLSIDESLKQLAETIMNYKDQYPELNPVHQQLENLKQLVKKCNLVKSPTTLSVESALESFDFLDDSEPESPRSDKDTGYSSCDDVLGNSGQRQKTKAGNDEESTAVIDEEETLQNKEESESSNEKEECTASSNSINTCLSLPSQTSSQSHSCQSGLDECQSSGIDVCQSSETDNTETQQECSVGNTNIDKVLLCHLQYCQELTEFLGSFGPLKFKESASLEKLQEQSSVFEQLINLVLNSESLDLIEHVCPNFIKDESLIQLWKNCVQDSILYISYSMFNKKIQSLYLPQIKEKFIKMEDTGVSLTLWHRISENGDETSFVPDDDIITIFQYNHFFSNFKTSEISGLIAQIAKELSVCSRLSSKERAVVLTQIRQFGDIPILKSCLQAVCVLLIDRDSVVQSTAGAFIHSLAQDKDSRQQALQHCLEALEERDNKVREGACGVLARLKAVEAVPLLLYLSRCDTTSVKAAARKALSTLGAAGEEALKQSSASPFESDIMMY